MRSFLLPLGLLALAVDASFFYKYNDNPVNNLNATRMIKMTNWTDVHIAVNSKVETWLNLQMPDVPFEGQVVKWVCDSAHDHYVNDFYGPGRTLFKGWIRYTDDQGRPTFVDDSSALHLLRTTAVDLMWNGRQWIITNQPVIGTTY